MSRMTDESTSWVRKLTRHIRSRIFSGLLILVPAGATLLILRLLFNMLFILVRPLSELRVVGLPSWAITALAIAILVLFVYLLGLLTTHVFGRKLVHLFEWVILRVPIVKSIYGASKQVIETLRTSTRRSFKAVAVIQFPKEGSYSLAFVTSETEDQNGERLISVFVPTTPNPTSGYLLILRETEVLRTGLTVEEGIKMIISGGVLIPPRLAVPGGKGSGTEAAGRIDFSEESGSTPAE